MYVYLSTRGSNERKILYWRPNVNVVKLEINRKVFGCKKIILFYWKTGILGSLRLRNLLFSDHLSAALPILWALTDACPMPVCCYHEHTSHLEHGLLFTDSTCCPTVCRCHSMYPSWEVKLPLNPISYWSISDFIHFVLVVIFIYFCI